MQLRFINFLKRYINQYTEAELAQILQHFFVFQNHKYFFNRLLICGIQTWLITQDRGSNMLGLAITFTICIFATPANSVLSEQAFSTMNYLIVKFCAKYSVKQKHLQIHNSADIETSGKSVQDLIWTARIWDWRSWRWGYKYHWRWS